MNIYTKSELENYLKNKKTYFSIDRFEDIFAVCENKETNEIINISKDLLPISSKSGDILKYESSELQIDLDKTKKEQTEVKKLVDALFKRKN